MKKLILFAVFALGVGAVGAQGILLQGNVGYKNDETKISGGSKTTIDLLDISPIVGYAFNDHWTVAVAPSFQMGKEKSGSTETKEDKTKIGGLVRYTQPLSDLFAVYADLGAGWQENKTTDKIAGTKTTSKQDGWYIGLNPALFINFKNNFGLNFSIGGFEYSHLEDKDTDVKDSKVDFTFGKSITLGISKVFKF